MRISTFSLVFQCIHLFFLFQPSYMSLKEVPFFCAFKNPMMDIKVNFRVLYWVDQNVSASYIFGCWVLCEIFSLCGGRNIFRNFETISLDLAGREERWNRADGIIFTRVESRSPKIDRLRVDSIILQYSKETKTNTEFYFTKYSILQR